MGARSRSNRNEWITLGLFFLALLMGGSVFAMILSSAPPPLGIALLLGGVPLVVIPFAIGWLTPSMWFLGGAVGIISLYSVISSLIYSLPEQFDIWLLQWPLFLPLLMGLGFAYLGRLARQRGLRRAI